MLAWERFTSNTAVTLLAANPHLDQEEKPVDDASFAMKVYHLRGETDLHGVLRLSTRHRWETGAGVARVVNDNLEVHGSLLYQRRYERLLNPLADSEGFPLAVADSLIRRRFNHGVKALFGSQWAEASGLSVLAEIWYDAEAYTRDEWRDLKKLTNRQLALLGTPGIPEHAVFANIAGNHRYFGAPNFLRWNILVRIASDGENWEPVLDLLYTPEDQGFVLTFGLSTVYDRHRFDLGLRRFGGRPNAAYHLLPDKWLGFLAWEWTLL